MNAPAIIQTQNTITVVFHQPEYTHITVNRDHPNFMSIRKAILDKDWESVKTLGDIKSSMEDYLDGDCEIRDGQVFFKGEEIHNSVADRILDLMKEGVPFEPLVKFLNNLMNNMSFRARKELYGFLENEHLPITEDGCFLAYKAVDVDYKDLWSGSLDNSVGNTVSMPRSRVDDDCNHGCSSGLHAGSIDYVESYGGHRPHRKLIVKINPKDVVSVPSDDCRKLRCSQYVVVKEFDAILEDSCYNDDASNSVGYKSETDYTNVMNNFEDQYDWDILSD